MFAVDPFSGSGEMLIGIGTALHAIRRPARNPALPLPYLFYESQGQEFSLARGDSVYVPAHYVRNLFIGHIGLVLMRSKTSFWER